MKRSLNESTGSRLLPLILVTSLFFLWGLSYGLLDVLNKHFQEVLKVGKRESGLLQAAYFGAYFLMALPAGWFMQRAGYKRGMIAGLLFFTVGAGLFYPASYTADFSHFLTALFILACGLAILETAANPYMTVLGAPEDASFRLNLAQGFNGVGSFLGPMLGGWLFFSDEASGHGLEQVRQVYVVIAVIVLFLAFIIFRTPLPEPEAEAKEAVVVSENRTWYLNKRFIAAVIALFCYVAAQVGIAAYFMNYATEAAVGYTSEQAAFLLSVALIVFTVGRFAGSFLMKRFSSGTVLTRYAVVNIVLCCWIAMHPHRSSVYFLVAVFFFESIMFPTIFALGVSGMGSRTKLASSILVMSIVGGAIVPYLMGHIAETWSTASAYFVPAVCFATVAWFGNGVRNIPAQ